MTIHDDDKKRGRDAGNGLLMVPVMKNKSDHDQS